MNIVIHLNSFDQLFLKLKTISYALDLVIRPNLVNRYRHSIKRNLFIKIEKTDQKDLTKSGVKVGFSKVI